MKRYIAENKNCFQCCVAGLFNLALEAVPDITHFGLDAKQRNLTQWFDSFYEWSRDYLAHTPVVIMEDDLDDTLDDIKHIVVYYNKRGITHCSIYKGSEELHDPALGANAPDVVEPVYRIIFIANNCPGGINHND